MSIAPNDRETAAKNHFSLEGEPAISPIPDWSKPEDPAIVVTFDFRVPSEFQAIDPNMKPIPKSGSTNGAMQRYSATVPLRQKETTTKIWLISDAGDVAKLEVQVAIMLPQPLLVTDPECAGKGIAARFETAPSGAPAVTTSSHPAPIAFVRCESRDARLATRVATWPGNSWTQAPTGWTGPTGRTSLEASLPPYPDYGNPQTYLFTLTPQGAPSSATTLSLTQSERPQPTWNISATLGPTWSSYTETAPKLPDVHVSQLGVTAKALAQFRVAPPRWDLAFSVFGTVAALSHDPDTLPSARWLGLNARVGYRIALDPAAVNTISLMPGIYAWSMYVDGDKYGVQNLNGPQLVVAVNHAQRIQFAKWLSMLRFGGYLKFAPVDTGFALNLANRELAAGGSATFAFKGTTRPLVVALDASTLDFAEDGFALNLKTFSISFGTSIF